MNSNPVVDEKDNNGFVDKPEDLVIDDENIEFYFYDFTLTDTNKALFNVKVANKTDKAIQFLVHMDEFSFNDQPVDSVMAMLLLPDEAVTDSFVLDGFTLTSLNVY